MTEPVEEALDSSLSVGFACLGPFSPSGVCMNSFPWYISNRICTQSIVMLRIIRSYIWMDKEALFTECAIREMRAVFLGMEELAFFVFEVAVGEESAPSLLLFFRTTLWRHVFLPLPYVVLMRTQVNYCVTRVEFHLFQLLWRYSTFLIRSFLDSLINVHILLPMTTSLSSDLSLQVWYLILSLPDWSLFCKSTEDSLIFNFGILLQFFVWNRCSLSWVCCFLSCFDQ